MDQIARGYVAVDEEGGAASLLAWAFHVRAFSDRLSHVVTQLESVFFISLSLSEQADDIFTHPHLATYAGLKVLLC